MRTLLRAFLTALLTAAAVVTVLPPPPAAALSCKGPEVLIPRAEILFTATIADVDPETERLTVVVKEGWRGGPVPARALVHVDDIALTGWSTGLHDKDQLYLFAPRKAGEGSYEIGPCSFWNPVRHLDARPSRVSLPGILSPPLVPAIEDEESHSGRWFLVVAGILIVAAAAGSVLRSRRAAARAAAQAEAEAEAEAAEKAAKNAGSVDPDQALLGDAGDEPAVSSEDPGESQPTPS